MEQLLQGRSYQTAAEERDGVPVDVGEGRVGIAEQTGYDRSARDAGDDVDLVEEVEVFESTQRAEVC